jgi:hypothetical protein
VNLSEGRGSLLWSALLGRPLENLGERKKAKARTGEALKISRPSRPLSFAKCGPNSPNDAAIPLGRPASDLPGATKVIALVFYGLAFALDDLPNVDQGSSGIWPLLPTFPPADTP